MIGGLDVLILAYCGKKDLNLIRYDSLATTKLIDNAKNKDFTA